MPGSCAASSCSSVAGGDDHRDARQPRPGPAQAEALPACSRRKPARRARPRTKTSAGQSASAGGANAPARQVLDPPSGMAQDGPGAPRAEHEIVEVLVEGQEARRRQQQGHQAHAAERHVGNQHHAGQADAHSRQLRAAARQVLAIPRPMRQGIHFRSPSSGGKSETTHSGSSGKIWRIRSIRRRFSSSVPLANATLIFGFKSDQQVAMRLRRRPSGMLP